MKILLHICCAPCSIYPLKLLKEKFDIIVGYFYRNNIHPYQECIKRENEVKKYISSLSSIKVIYQKDYNLEKFIRSISFRENNRCFYCYYDRLRSSALIAKNSNFDFFSSTLLYSKFQKHELIQEIGRSISVSLDIPFYYEDFRIGWQYGVIESKKLKLYRQNYCGCIYSEKERFFQKNKN